MDHIRTCAVRIEDVVGARFEPVTSRMRRRRVNSRPATGDVVQSNANNADPKLEVDGFSMWEIESRVGSSPGGPASNWVTAE